MDGEKRPFAARLREERRRLELSQAQVADAAKISERTQVSYEADLHVPDLEYLTAVARLGIDAIYVVTGQRERELVQRLFDWELLREIADTIQQRADLKKISIPPGKVIELAQRLYNKEVADGHQMDAESAEGPV